MSGVKCANAGEKYARYVHGKTKTQYTAMIIYKEN